MANLRDIRNRIQSVKNTQQITRAMKMVSAAKLRRAQNNIQNLRPFANHILSVIADVAATQRLEHKLLATNEAPKKVLLVVLTSDRGLAGGFNNNINRYAYKFWQENKGKYEKMDFLFIGRKGSDFFKTRGVAGVETILNLAREVAFPLAQGVSNRLMDEFNQGGYDAVFLVYNEFKSAISQTVAHEQLLPVDISRSNLKSEAGQSAFAADMIFEPSPEEIIEDLLKKHFAIQVYRAMCESVAAEHGARMAAMENATKNAGEMIRSMTLTYNKLRQASITTELIEITSGAEALKG
jgi:F-type H+-transporting ATPase subunit gamma